MLAVSTSALEMAMESKASIVVREHGYKIHNRMIVDQLAQKYGQPEFISDGNKQRQSWTSFDAKGKGGQSLGHRSHGSRRLLGFPFAAKGAFDGQGAKKS